MKGVGAEGRKKKESEISEKLGNRITTTEKGEVGWGRESE